VVSFALGLGPALASAANEASQGAGAGPGLLGAGAALATGAHAQGVDYALATKNGQQPVTAVPPMEDAGDSVPLSLARALLLPMTLIQKTGQDLRVPARRGTEIALVNGGVHLPVGVEQQFFVVQSN